jgi:tRNA(fMet)-specific endonuclease VapC
MILDTSFLHDIMHGDEDALDRAIEVENRHTVKLSSVSVYKLYYGVGYTDSTDEERQKVDSVIGSKHVLPADTEVMRKAGKMDGQLSRDGASVGQADIIIGATALLQDEPVLTRNVSEFERIPALDVETY